MMIKKVVVYKYNWCVYKAVAVQVLGRSLVRIWLMSGGGSGGVGVIRDWCCCCVVVTLINRSEVVAINYGFPLVILSSSFGVIKNALNAKQMNTIPPTMVTRYWKTKKEEESIDFVVSGMWIVYEKLPVRTEIRCAIIRPPITANPVHSAWPKTPPTITPYTLSRAAKTIVVNCERSPHSAKKVIEHAWIRTRIIMDRLLFDLDLRVGVGTSVTFTSTCGLSSTVTTPRSTSGKRIVDVAVSFSN